MLSQGPSCKFFVSYTQIITTLLMAMVLIAEAMPRWQWLCYDKIVPTCTLHAWSKFQDLYEVEAILYIRICPDHHQTNGNV